MTEPRPDPAAGDRPPRRRVRAIVFIGAAYAVASSSGGAVVFAFLCLLGPLGSGYFDWFDYLRVPLFGGLITAGTCFGGLVLWCGFRCRYGRAKHHGLMHMTARVAHQLRTSLVAAMMMTIVAATVLVMTIRSGRIEWFIAPPDASFYTGVALTTGIAVSAAAFVALALRGRTDAIERRADRTTLDRCGCCGYDLRHAVSAACPECGEPKPAAAATERSD